MANNKTHIAVDISKYPEDTTRFQLPSKHFDYIVNAMNYTSTHADFEVPKHIQASVANELREAGLEVATGVGMFANKINVSSYGM